MEMYYFLFGLALVWIIFAAVQDIKREEVANWLNFSLIGFALAYRAFYAMAFDYWEFFGFGLLGFGVFFCLANVFYYARVFAGGDAKLLMGIGVVLPFESFYSLMFEGIGFLFVLFASGAVYSLIYSVFLAFRCFEKFGEKFVKRFKKEKIIFVMLIIFGIVLLVLSGLDIYGIYGALFLIVIGVLYVYLRVLDEHCLIKKIKPCELREGDWLEQDVKIGNKVLKKSVHGLSKEEIKMLKKAGKKVLIKKGIPFVPAFLIAWIIMVFFYLVLGLSFYQIFSFFL